jgi:hypothetical protein
MQWSRSCLGRNQWTNNTDLMPSQRQGDMVRDPSTTRLEAEWRRMKMQKVAADEKSSREHMEGQWGIDNNKRRHASR